MKIRTVECDKTNLPFYEILDSGRCDNVAPISNVTFAKLYIDDNEGLKEPNGESNKS